MPEQFYSLTWNQYCLKCEGFFNKDKKEWERVGWATYNAVAIHVKKGAMPSFKKFMRFLYQTEPMQKATLDKIKETMNKAMAKYIADKNKS